MAITNRFTISTVCLLFLIQNLKLSSFDKYLKCLKYVEYPRPDKYQLNRLSGTSSNFINNYVKTNEHKKEVVSFDKILFLENIKLHWIFFCNFKQKKKCCTLCVNFHVIIKIYSCAIWKKNTQFYELYIKITIYLLL